MLGKAFFTTPYDHGRLGLRKVTGLALPDKSGAPAKCHRRRRYDTARHVVSAKKLRRDESSEEEQKLLS